MISKRKWKTKRPMIQVSCISFIPKSALIKYQSQSAVIEVMLYVSQFLKNPLNFQNLNFLTVKFYKFNFFKLLNCKNTNFLTIIF